MTCGQGTNEEKNSQRAVIDLSSLSWPNALTRMVFENLFIVKGSRHEANFKNDQNWYKLVFAKTDFSAYDIDRLQIELEEFYDFAVLDFLEILEAAKYNPVKTVLNVRSLHMQALQAILEGNKTEIDFRLLAERILSLN